MSVKLYSLCSQMYYLCCKYSYSVQIIDILQCSSKPVNWLNDAKLVGHIIFCLPFSCSCNSTVIGYSQCFLTTNPIQHLLVKLNIKNIIRFIMESTVYMLRMSVQQVSWHEVFSMPPYTLVIFWYQLTLWVLNNFFSLLARAEISGTHNAMK